MPLTQVQGGMLAGSTNTTTTIQSNGTTAITIDSSQNVGIGVVPSAWGSGPQAIQNSSGAIWQFGSSNIYVGQNYYFNGTNRIYTTTAEATEYQQGAGIHRWYTAPSGTAGTSVSLTERMRIDSSGNLIMASSAGYLQLPTNQTMRIPSTGGISYVGNINSATVFQIAYNSTSAGVQLSSGATSWGTFSDSRLKNITGTYTNALNDIAQIQPVKFTWKADEDSKPQVGVIAQSIQNVVPEAVDSTTIEMDGTEKYLTVRYTELIPLMIASIQELNAKVDAQAAEIAALKAAP